MRVIIDRMLPVALAIVFLVGLHGTEALMAAQAQLSSHDCGCSTDCACRGPDNGCDCSRPEFTIKARCGCGGSGPQHGGMAPSWHTVLAPGCSMGAPLLMWSSTPNLGDPQAWQLPYEHEHPPRPLP